MHDAADQVWIWRVRNWERFQHYKDRNPPWIKLHRDLGHDIEFLQLNDVQKVQLMSLWLLAAKLDNELPTDARYLERFNLSEEPFDLEVLQMAGKIECVLKKAKRKRAASKVASKPLAKRSENAMPEREGEREKETPLTPLGEVREIFGYWVEARQKNPNLTRLTDKRRKVIKARLAEFDTATLKRAIDGVAHDPWEGRREHDDLTIIFRPENVEKMLAFADSPLTAEERRKRHLEALRSEGRVA